MKLLRTHPITSRLFGLGIPGWLGFALAGWPLAIVAIIVLGVAIFLAGRT